MEAEQVLKVGVTAVDLWTGWQFFYARMGGDGRIVVPKLTLDLLRGDNPDLAGYVLEVSLAPT